MTESNVPFGNVTTQRPLSDLLEKRKKKKAIPRHSLPPWRQMITIIPIRSTLCKHRSFCTNFYTANGCCILVRVLCYISVTFTGSNICVFFSFKRHSFISNNLSFRNKFVFCYFRTFVWLFTSFGSTSFNIEGGYRQQIDCSFLLIVIIIYKRIRYKSGDLLINVALKRIIINPVILTYL